MSDHYSERPGYPIGARDYDRIQRAQLNQDSDAPEFARQAGPIVSNLNRLERQLDELDAIFAELHTRLDPMLRPNPPTPGPSDQTMTEPDQDPQSHVAAQLDKYARRIAGASRRLGSLLDRVEL